MEVRSLGSLLLQCKHQAYWLICYKQIDVAYIRNKVTAIDALTIFNLYGHVSI